MDAKITNENKPLFDSGQSRGQNIFVYDYSDFYTLQNPLKNNAEYSMPVQVGPLIPYGNSQDTSFPDTGFPDYFKTHALSHSIRFLQYYCHKYSGGDMPSLEGKYFLSLIGNDPNSFQTIIRAIWPKWRKKECATAISLMRLFILKNPLQVFSPTIALLKTTKSPYVKSAYKRVLNRWRWLCIL